MRNPKWHRDEIILALDLYFKTKPGSISASNPEVVALSKILNELPIHSFRPDPTKFRNPNGVSLKLSNFLTIDEAYTGKGMSSHSALDKKVFNEFSTRKDELAEIAKNIKLAVSIPELNDALYRIDATDTEEDSVQEGQVLYKLHKVRERNSKITKRKKAEYFKQHGKLDCEVCKFDFHKQYGEHGKGFIECHHRTPLAKLDATTNTKLEDLALVCANCHRMLHYKMADLDLLTLTGLVKTNF